MGSSVEQTQALLPDFEVREYQEGDMLEPTTEPIPPAEPLAVSAYQLRRALSAKNLRTAVETAITASPQAVKDEWEFKTSYRRDHPTVAMIAAAIGKTDADIDEVFQLALTFD